MLLSSDNQIKEDNLPAYLIEAVKGGANLDLKSSKIKKIEEIEKESIMKVLKINNGNISLSVQQMGLARNIIYRKIRKYGINK